MAYIYTAEIDGHDHEFGQEFETNTIFDTSDTVSDKDKSKIKSSDTDLDTTSETNPDACVR